MAKRRPKTAAEQRATDFGAVNLAPDASALPRQADIEITRAGGRREGQRVKEDTARRLDAFSALKDGMAQGAYDAARRFERDVLTRLGVTDGGPQMERVDNGMAKDHAEALKRAMAGERIEAVQDRIPPRDFWLLMELIAPRIERGGWRETVAYITGEAQPHAQCAVVRSACVNLRDAYVAIERRAA